MSRQAGKHHTQNHWLPPMLAGQRFTAWFEFDGERMLSKDVRLEA